MAVPATSIDVAGRFPVLEDRSDIVYLDSAATSQTPRQVLDAMDDYYAQHRATVHRSVYPLAAEATELFEGARNRIAAFVNSPAKGTIFTRNATEAFNLVAYAWGRANVRAGDRVLVTLMEHHSNFVPWHVLCREVGAELVVLPLLDDGTVDLDAYAAELARGVKLAAMTHVSNVLGTISPVVEMVRLAREAGATTVVDGTQAVPQLPVDAGAIGADFYVWTGHKAYGPTGVGVLHGDVEVLKAMPPFLGGGHMISSVSIDEIRWAELPHKFEAGTSAVAEAIGLGAAVDFLGELGMDAVRAHEQELTAYALPALGEVEGLQIQGPTDPAIRAGLISFTLDYAHPHDIAEIIGSRGVCVRAGHHCAQPLMQSLGVSATTRASFAVHNSPSDVDALVDAIGEVQRIFG